MTSKSGLLVLAVCAAASAGIVSSQNQRTGVPIFQVDAAWPRPLPNNWTFGEFSGVAVDSHDHVWINQRPKTLADDEKYLTQNPPPGDCCLPGPPIMEFDADEVPWKAKLLTKPYVIENGELLLPSGAGWGTAVNEAVIRAHPAKMSPIS